MTDLSEALKTLRENKGWSQAELARRSGIEQTTYHRLEKQGGKMNIDQATDIAKALGMSLMELLTYGEEQKATVSGEQSESGEIERLRERVKELEDRISDKNARLEQIQLAAMEAIMDRLNDQVTHWLKQNPDKSISPDEMVQLIERQLFSKTWVDSLFRASVFPTRMLKEQWEQYTFMKINLSNVQNLRTDPGGVTASEKDREELIRMENELNRRTQPLDPAKTRKDTQQKSPGG